MNKQTEPKINLWPFLIIFIGVSFLGVTGWSIYRAKLGVSPVTDPQYYSHGLKYNKSNIELKAAEASGWSVKTTLKDHDLLFDLNDDKGKAIAGCQGSLTIYSSDRSQQRLSPPLVEKYPGRYAVLLPDDLQGSITGDLTLHREGARINRRLIINL